MDDEFIWVNGWDEYQSFQKKRGRAWSPPWIKLYPRLLSNHDFLHVVRKCSPSRRQVDAKSLEPDRATRREVQSCFA